MYVQRNMNSLDRTLNRIQFKNLLYTANVLHRATYFDGSQFPVTTGGLGMQAFDIHAFLRLL